MGKNNKIMDLLRKILTIGGDGGNNVSVTFCADPFWDQDRTWNTNRPDFTRCFHQVGANFTFFFSNYGTLEVLTTKIFI